MTLRKVLVACAVAAVISAAAAGTEILSVEWDPGLGVIVVRLDAFPSWGGWRMLVDGAEITMEGGDGYPVVRPNAPLDEGATGLFIGTTPWVGPLPSGALPCAGTIQFDIPHEGRTNTFAYDLSTSYCSGIASESAGTGSGRPVGGAIHADTTWQGEILVTGSVFVPSGVTLTILPGTTVRFTPYRGYTDPSGRLSMRVEGTLKAVGTATAPIWFTSAADDPMNGDWSMLRLVDASPASEIRFAILEFAQQGLNLWNSSPAIADVIVRWNNWEGIYLESYCKPTIERARIYQNGYNGIAMEQFNGATVRDCYIADSGTHGIHVDASNASIETCILEGNAAAGVSVDDHGKVTVEACVIRGNESAIGCGEGQNELHLDGSSILTGNTYDTPRCQPSQRFPIQSKKTAPSSIAFPMPDYRPYELGYTPGNRRLDRYPYVYPLVDETRRVVGAIGDGLGLTWSVAWDGVAIWTATLWGNVYRLDPATGAVLTQWQYPGPQAWGMTYDGEHLWINDFAEKRIYEMTTDGRVVSSFAIPDTQGGAKGIAWDGEALCIMGWTSPTIYRVTRRGVELNRIPLQEGGGGLAWDGSAFWVPGGLGILRVSAQGEPLGAIHACSEGTWDLAWDGRFLWATQRTNENWFDEKLFRIEIGKLLR